jgi:geranylgeranyl pyrophosphate synthase
MKDFVAGYAEPVNRYLNNWVEGERHPLSKILKEHLGAGGKKIRPAMLLLSYEAVSLDRGHELAIPLAAIYELAHTSALIQDDILDRAPLRRNRETIWKKHGTNTAILASDLLLFEIFTQLTRYRNRIKDDILYKTLEIIGDTSKKTAIGEFMDEHLGKRKQISLDSYFEMIRFKTASLLRGAAESGAALGGGSKNEVGLLGSFGEHIGMAYQIRDDIMDVTGNETAMGKPLFQDIRNSRTNIVVVHALNNAGKKDLEFLRNLLDKKEITPTETGRLRGIFEKCKSVEYAEGMARDFSEKGRALLDKLRGSEARDKLKKLSYYAEKRMY